MDPTAIERCFPTFAPPARRFFLAIEATLRAVIGEARRVRSRFVVRFSLRVLMIVVLVVGGGMGWAVRRARIQREAVASVKRAGGSAWYDWQWKGGRPDHHKFQISPAPERPRRHMMETELKQIRDQYNPPQTSGRSWRMRGLGADCFSHVIQVSMGPHGTDMELVPVGWLDGLEILNLNSSAVTDAGMAHLNGLTNLEILCLNDTQVGDAGVAHLAGLTRLKTLDLSNTQVTDVGLARLASLNGLQELYLSNTRVTDAGLAHLKEMTALRKLHLEGTQIGDAGLAYLKGLTNLDLLDLDRTRISDGGLAQLEELTSLSQLPPNFHSLQGLGLFNTKVTNAGIGALQNARPRVRLIRGLRD
jgi:Leucine Rich repeats (2 copies)/Leucine Rich repeat